MSESPAVVLPFVRNSIQAGRAIRPVQAWVVEIADGACLVGFDVAETLPAGPVAARIDGVIDGERLPRPLLSTQLALRAGGTRCLIALRRSARSLAQARLDLTVGDAPAAFLDPDWLQFPDREPEELIDGLSQGARPRFARFFLSSLMTLVAGNRSRGFHQTASRLLAALDVRRGHLAGFAAVGRTGVLVGYRLDRPLGRVPGRALSLSRAGIAVLDPLTAFSEAGQTLHLFLPRAESRGVPDIVLNGESPLVLSARGTGLRPVELADWLGGQSAAVRSWAGQVLARETGEGPAPAEEAGAGEPLPEMRSFVAWTPRRLLVWADVPGAGRGARTLRVGFCGTSRDLPIPPGGRLRACLGTDGPWPGLPARPGAPEPEATLALVGAAGRVLSATACVPVAFRGAVPPEFIGGADDAAIAAYAAAWSDRAVPAPEAAVSVFGSAPARPKLSLIVPLAADPDLVRARAALVACEAGGAGVEVDCVVEGAPSDDLRELLALVARCYGIAHRLVALPRGLSAPDRLHAALRAARADRVLCLGPAVIPEAPGWLAPWLRALPEGGVARVVAGTIVSCHGTVLHAGGQLRAGAGRAEPVIDLTRTGFPAGDVARGGAAATGVISVEAVGLNRAARAAVLGAAPASPDPGLGLLQAAGTAGRARLLQGPRFLCVGDGLQDDALVRGAGLWLLAGSAAAGEAS